MGYLSFPNAKINIGLQVTAKQENGYHSIESVFYPVPLHDAIEFILHPNQTTIHLSGIPINEGAMNDNLCYKAWEILYKQYNIPYYDIFLHKNIPIGAGLGGGSSNGTCVLKELNKLNNLGLSTSTLSKLSKQLGSDCSFFIENKPCLVSGIGDLHTAIDLNLSGHHLVLVYPDIFISTPMAYANILPKPSEYSLQSAIAMPINQWKNNIVNDFEEWALNKHPDLQEIKDLMYSSGALYASMSGSGSSMYAIFNQSPPQALKEKINDYTAFIFEL